MSEWVSQRVETQPDRLALIREMFITRGTYDDWLKLHDFHYKSEGRVMGARYYRVVTETGALVGVCVMCYPRGLLRDRHRLFPNIKPDGNETKLTNTYRYKYLNRFFSLNARTVNDPLYRGVGVGYRMLNLAARMDGRQWCEIQSSMSRFNKFAHQAGFQFVTQTANKNAEPAAALYATWFDANPADQVSLLDEYSAMPEPTQERVLAALREFYWKISSLEKTGSNRLKTTSRVDTMSFKDVVKNINQVAFASPLYGVYRNPDWGRQMPDVLPLTAFDEQGVDEPLRRGWGAPCA